MIAITLLHHTAWAEWLGPQEIVVGTWGSGSGQFYFGAGDSGDDFPRDFGVDSRGRIFINDEGNGRIQIYSTTGSLEKAINAPTGVNIYGWPYNIYVHPDGALIASYEGPQKFFFDSSGNFVTKVDVYGPAYPVSQGFILYVTDKTYSLYSPTGALIRTTTERPLELGKVSEKKTAAGYTYTIQYPDLVNPNTVKTYTVSRLYPCSNYTRDKNGNLYCIGDNGVIRFDEQGNEIASVIIPESSFQEIPRGPGVEPKIKVIAQYGEPVISPTGDVYTWKRTPERYSIIKWTWRP